MSDVQSLTLPRPDGMSIARRRRRWRPPKNWRRLALITCWDAVVFVFDIIAAAQGHSLNGVAAVGFAASLQIDVRCWRRPDGRPRPEDRPLVMLGMGAWLACIASLVLSL